MTASPLYFLFSFYKFLRVFNSDKAHTHKKARLLDGKTASSTAVKHWGAQE